MCKTGNCKILANFVRNNPISSDRGNRMDVKKVLYISQEIEPYLPANALNTFGRSLPQAMLEKGAEVRTFMPKYGNINERRNQLHEVIRLSGLNIPIDDTDHPLLIKVATLQPSRLQVYFIDNDDFFMRHESGKLETEHDAAVNDERSIFFVRGTSETVRKLRWEPSVIHCTGWITALAPLYFKTVFADDPVFRNARIVYSLFSNKFEGTLDPRMPEKLRADGIPAKALANFGKDGSPLDYITLNKLAIDYADAIAVSSEDMEQELTDYAKASGKPVLEYPGAGNTEAYHEFYKSL